MKEKETIDIFDMQEAMAKHKGAKFCPKKLNKVVKKTTKIRQGLEKAVNEHQQIGWPTGLFDIPKEDYNKDSLVVEQNNLDKCRIAEIGLKEIESFLEDSYDDKNTFNMDDYDINRKTK